MYARHGTAQNVIYARQGARQKRIIIFHNEFLITKNNKRAEKKTSTTTPKKTIASYWQNIIIFLYICGYLAEANLGKAKTAVDIKLNYSIVNKTKRIDIFRLRRLLLMLLMLSSSSALRAQNSEIAVGLRGGHNAAFGGFAALSVEGSHTFGERFLISGGAQYATYGRTAVETRPAYLWNYKWGTISTEALLSYTNLTSVNNLVVGAGADIYGRWIGFKLGYYYRLYGHRGNSICEPFNIYYELRANLLPKIERWDLQLAITNNETFEIERHFQPSFIAQCRYFPQQRLGLSLGIGCKPAGMFNMSADYYQSFIKLGVCYKW